MSKAPSKQKRKRVNVRRPDIMEEVQAEVEQHYRSPIIEKLRERGGTLTIGKPQLTDIVTLNGTDSEHILAYVAAAEALLVPITALLAQPRPAPAGTVRRRSATASSANMQNLQRERGRKKGAP